MSTHGDHDRTPDECDDLAPVGMSVNGRDYYVISRWATWLCVVLTFLAGFMAGAAVVTWIALH